LLSHPPVTYTPRFRSTGDGRFRFRTPTLRNVALTAPYMHNGTLPTLEEVLRFYDEGRSRNPNVADARSRRRDRDEENDERRIPRDRKSTRLNSSHVKS